MEVCIRWYYVFNNCVMAVRSVENEIFDADFQNLADAVVSVRTKSNEALTVFTESIYIYTRHKRQ